jgi:hypothetical protein
MRCWLKGVAGIAEEAPYLIPAAIIQISLIGIAMNVSVLSHAFLHEANIWH